MSPRTPLIHPVTYFERPYRPSLSHAAIVVVANAILFTVFVWWFVIDLITRLDAPPEAVSAVKSAIIGRLVFLFIGVLVDWLLVSGILHVVVWLADGEQTFGATLAVVGIADLVSLVLFPLTATGFLLMVGNMPPNPTTEQVAEFIQTAVSRGSPLLILTTLIVGFWKAFIRAIGLSIVHNIAFEKIGVVVFILAILGILGQFI